MIGLTRQQDRCLAFLRERCASGPAPSFIEIMDHLGLHSKAGVHRLLKALEERGRIRRLFRRARSIEVLEDEPRRCCPNCGHPL